MLQKSFFKNRQSSILRAIKDPNLSVNRAIYAKPINVSIEEAEGLPLCVNCKHFLLDKFSKEPNHALCKKHGEVSLIDGTVTYKNVTVARQYFCHGNDFEIIDRTEYGLNNHKEILD